MENIRDLQIQVDLLYGALPVSRNLKQGDTTRLTLTVFRGGKSYPLESLTPILNAKRADKLIYIQTSDYDVNDNSITYNLAPQIVAEPGRLQLEIELNDADGNIISSFTIGITVEPRLFNGEEDVAPDDQNEIIDAAREAALSVAQARDAAQTAVDARDTAVQTINTSRDNAVANVNKAADKRIEEINAVGVDGTVRFDEAQELTDVQMTQARANVGAASAAEVDKLSKENANIKGDLSDLAPAGAAVGQLFRVAAISEDGKYTMEPVDMLDVRVNGDSIVQDGVAIIPLANGFGKTGIVRLANGLGVKWSNANGSGLSIDYANINLISNRSASNNPIIPYYLDDAVKAAMCDGKGAAWTDAERIAALLRMGCTVDGNGFVKWGASE